MHGWMGKILDVDLTSSKISQIPTEPYIEKYLGGRGIATRLYWEKVSPTITAFDPGNVLIFMTGPLVATGAQAASRMMVVGKSPMAYPEEYSYGSIGGFFPAELKKAGFDGIVIEGKAPRPVYLWINNSEAELRDAASLWGLGVYKVKDILEENHGKSARVMTTGVAGERKVRTAVIAGTHDSTCTGGFGAVMGSKNLKAIAVKGTGKPSVADPEKLKELNRYAVKLSKRFRLSTPPNVEATQHQDVLEVIGKGGCYQCGLECIRGIYRYSNGSVGNRRCQAQEYYLPWNFSKKDEPVQTLFDEPVLANDYSICTIELESVTKWLYACYQSGALTEQETGLPLAKIGTREFLEKLLSAIAYREGFGDILAEGIVRAREKVSEKARSLIITRVAPIGHRDHNPPRAVVAYALIYPMESRIHQPLVHNTNFLHATWCLNLMQPGLTPVTSKVFHDVAERFWGSREAGDLSTYEGKALAAVKIQNSTYVKDSLGLCDFAWPIMYSYNTPDHVGDPHLEAKIFTAVTGLSAEKFDTWGDTIFNLQRAILLQEGRKPPECDFPPEYNFTQPLELDVFGRPVMVPGPDEKPIDATGKMLDRNKFIAMLKEYYRLRGWDEETGLPLAKTLASLGLDDVVSRLRLK